MLVVCQELTIIKHQAFLAMTFIFRPTKEIEDTYALASAYLQSSVCSFIWESGARHELWTVSTWSIKTQRNYILKHGTDSDKAYLPKSTWYNAKHKKKRTFSAR